MENGINISPEERARRLEEAQRKAQETLAGMTPEERAQAEARAREAIAADEAARQRLLDDAAKVLNGETPGSAPKFCGNCGAKAEGGKFCPYCGSPLQTTE